MAQAQLQPMPLRQANNNWHNVPGAAQVSWSADGKQSKAVNNPFTSANPASRSASEAGLVSETAYSREPMPARDRFTSFSGPSTPRSNASSGQRRDPSPPSSVGASGRMHRQPSLVDMVKTLPPVVETSAGTRFNASEFVAHLDGPHAMKERHRKIQAAIEILQSVIQFEEQEYQQQQKMLEQQRIEQQRLEQQRLEQQRIEQQRIEQQRLDDLRRIQEQQRAQEQQRMQEQQRLKEQRIVEQQQQQLAQLQQLQQQQHFQQPSFQQPQYQQPLPSWNQTTTPAFERKESNPLLAEIKAEHEYRAYAEEVQKEEEEAERGRSFSIFRSRKQSTSASPASSRERKASEWAAGPAQFRERQGSDWFSAASENRKGSVANAGMAEFRERKGSDWYSTAAERKASVAASEYARKGSLAPSFRKGSTAGMPKTRRPSEWSASAACFA